MFDIDKLINEAYGDEPLSFEKLAEMVEDMMILQESLGGLAPLNENLDSQITDYAPFIAALDRLVFTMPTEQTGKLDSPERQTFVKYITNNIAGSNLSEGIKNMNAYAENPHANPADKINEILANIGMIRIAKRMIEDYTDSSAGFVFEQFLAALYGGQQVIEIAGGSLPIEDVMLSVDPKTGKGGQPVSLKLLSPTTPTHGSLDNLLHFYTKPDIAERAAEVGIEYIVGVKSKDQRVGVYSFNLNPAGSGKDNFFFWIDPNKYFDWDAVGEAFNKITGAQLTPAPLAMNEEAQPQQPIEPSGTPAELKPAPKTKDDLMWNYKNWKKLLKKNLVDYFGYDKDQDDAFIFKNPKDMKDMSVIINKHTKTNLRDYSEPYLLNTIKSFPKSIEFPKTLQSRYFEKYFTDFFDFRKATEFMFPGNLRKEMENLEKITEGSKTSNEARYKYLLDKITIQDVSDLAFSLNKLEIKDYDDLINKTKLDANDVKRLIAAKSDAKAPTTRSTPEAAQRKYDELIANYEKTYGPDSITTNGKYDEKKVDQLKDANNSDKPLRAQSKAAIKRQVAKALQAISTAKYKTNAHGSYLSIMSDIKEADGQLINLLSRVYSVWNTRIDKFKDAIQASAPGFAYSLSHVRSVARKYDSSAELWDDPRAETRLGKPMTSTQMAKERFKINKMEYLQSWLARQLGVPTQIAEQTAPSSPTGDTTKKKKSNIAHPRDKDTGEEDKNKFMIGFSEKGKVTYDRPEQIDGKWSPTQAVQIWAMSLKAGLKKVQFTINPSDVKADGTVYGTIKISDDDVKKYFEAYGKELKKKCIPIYVSINNFTNSMNNYFLHRPKEETKESQSEEITKGIRYAEDLLKNAKALANE